MARLPPPAEAALLLHAQLLLWWLFRALGLEPLGAVPGDLFPFELTLGLAIGAGYGLLLGTPRYLAAPLYARGTAVMAALFAIFTSPALLTQTPVAHQTFGPAVALMVLGLWAGLSTGWLKELRRLRRARAETLLRFSQAAVDSSIGVALRMLDAADVALGLRADRLDPQKKAILVGRILALRRSAQGDPDPRQLLVAVDQLAAEMLSDGGPWAPRDRS